MLKTSVPTILRVWSMTSWFVYKHCVARFVVLMICYCFGSRTHHGGPCNTMFCKQYTRFVQTLSLRDFNLKSRDWNQGWSDIKPLWRKLWRNMQLCYTKYGNPVIGRFRNFPHSISHTWKHIWKHKYHDSKLIKLWQKNGKMSIFSDFFLIGGAKFSKTPPKYNLPYIWDVLIIIETL